MQEKLDTREEQKKSVKQSDGLWYLKAGRNVRWTEWDQVGLKRNSSPRKIQRMPLPLLTLHPTAKGKVPRQTVNIFQVDFPKSSQSYITASAGYVDTSELKVSELSSG